MGIQCAATFTLALALPKRPFITFRCEREAHEDGDHRTSGEGSQGEQWQMNWRMPEKGG